MEKKNGEMLWEKDSVWQRGPQNSMGLKSERKNNKYKDSRNVDNKAKFKKKK